MTDTEDDGWPSIRLEREMSRYKPKEFRGSLLKYDDRTVAFLDVLGWRDAITSNPDVPPAGVRAVVANATALYQNTISRNGAFRVAQFSDSIVMSSGTTNQEINFVCEMVSSMQMMYLGYGVIVRGGVTIGKLFHHGNVVVGPALIRAYAELENRLAIFPRVIADPAVEANLLSLGPDKRGCEIWRRDFDGLYFIDFIRYQHFGGYKPSAALDSTREAINFGLGKHHNNPNVRTKFEWLSSYCSVVEEEFAGRLW